MSTQVETHEFQAETRQLLDLMVHSVYSNKDTFLRELLSNASDALDKLRLAAYQDKDLDVDTSDLHIELETDASARTLTVRDNGIGMSRAEVIDLIGTLARSGTAELTRKLKEAKGSSASAELIGKFGIGFYATFMVADKVTLTTRKAGETTGTSWESTGDGTYTIAELDEAPQGTAVQLHLKPEDTDDSLFDYTAETKLRQIVKKHSDFLSWPIRMDVTRGSGDEVTVEKQTLNSSKALWARPKDEISEEELTEFYRHISHAWDTPLETISLKAEGTFEYQALLFIPSTAPMDLYMRERKRGVQLYVRRVFIMDDCEALMPEYLRFIKGVVDAQDLSLNVSREILQQDRQINMIRRRLVKKVLSTIADVMKNDAEKYQQVWEQFGRTLKEGLLEDRDNQQTVLGICSFASTNSESELTTLSAYVERMKAEQEVIYYATGETRQQIEASPHIEAFKARGLEVLLLTDPVDEMWSGGIPEFEGKTFQSIAKGEVDLSDAGDDGDDDKVAQREKQAEDFGPLLTWLTSTLSEEVKDVRLSNRLTSSPVCLVGEAFAMSPQLEKMFRASGQDVPVSKRTLELNPTHPLVLSLKSAHEARPDDNALVGTAQLLYGIAVLAEGGELADPAQFTGLLTERLVQTLS